MGPARATFHQQFPDIGEIIDQAIDKLFSQLGESPEAIRGAYEMGRMLNESLELLIEREKDLNRKDMLVFMLGAPIIFFKERAEELGVRS